MAAPSETATRAGDAEETARAREGRSFFAELPVLVGIAVVLALLLKTFLIQAFFIPSQSMIPTLEIGDRVLVNKVVYQLRDPRRGEVVVFREDDAISGPDTRSLAEKAREFLASGLGASPNERDFIKRVIGLPGEEIEMRDGVVLIGGEPLPEELAAQGGYLAAEDLDAFGPVTVPDDSYFMMGDNRPNSSDSRFSLGPIPEDQIIGRAFVTIWPLGRLSTLGHPEFPVLGSARERAP